VDLQYKPDLASFAEDKNKWVPPAILSAAREVASLKNSFPNLAMRNRGLAGAADTVVTVRRSIDRLMDGWMDGPMRVCLVGLLCAHTQSDPFIDRDPLHPHLPISCR
jgi:hypothetical protein